MEIRGRNFSEERKREKKTTWVEHAVCHIPFWVHMVTYWGVA